MPALLPPNLPPYGDATPLKGARSHIIGPQIVGPKIVGLKIDVDTERGTRVGVPRLLTLFETHQIQGTFLFSLGPDNMGRAIKRIFQPGFFQKVSRTNILKTYGLRTLLNGVLIKGPMIGKRHGPLMQRVAQMGHEVGVHCYDHVAWQNNLHRWSEPAVRAAVNRSVDIFQSVFGCRPLTMGAAGWQANDYSLAAYDEHRLAYASDTRGSKPFYPVGKRRQFNTLQLPTTLPTLDELLGRLPKETLIDHYLTLIQQQSFNVMTLHAEIEGMAEYAWFESFLVQAQQQGIQFVPLIQLCHDVVKEKSAIPKLPLIQGTLDGRGGVVAMHG